MYHDDESFTWLSVEAFNSLCLISFFARVRISVNLNPNTVYMKYWCRVVNWNKYIVALRRF